MLPPGFEAELRRAHRNPHLPCESLPGLCRAVADHYNTDAPEYTNAAHVVVGTHADSLVFLLRLAVETCNQCAVPTVHDDTPPRADRTPWTLYERSHDAPHDAPHDDATRGTTPLAIPFQRGEFPETTTTRADLVHASPPLLRVSYVTTHFTGGNWSCAFVVFPSGLPRPLQTAYTSVRYALTELLREVRAQPSAAVQHAAVLATTPWMVSYYDRRKQAMYVATQTVVAAFARVGVDVVPADDPVVAVTLSDAVVSTAARTGFAAHGVSTTSHRGQLRLTFAHPGDTLDDVGTRATAVAELCS